MHINSGVVTVGLAEGHDTDGLADIIRGLYTFYGAAVPLPARDAAGVNAEASDEAAAERARAQVPEGHAEQADRARPITEEPSGEA